MSEKREFEADRDSGESTYCSDIVPPTPQKKRKSILKTRRVRCMHLTISPNIMIYDKFKFSIFSQKQIDNDHDDVIYNE